VLGTALLLGAGAGAAFGATYTVTTTGDVPGKCEPVPTTCTTLREAIEAVDKAPSPPDVINLPTGTIELLAPLPIRAGMTIHGAPTTLDGEEAEGPVIVVETSGPPKSNTVVGLEALNLTGGLAENGGAIDAVSKSGALTLDVSGGTINGNVAEEYGGAIAIETGEDASINMANETMAKNKAGIGGGAIQFEPKGATLNSISIARSTFTENTTGKEGGSVGAEGGAIRFEPLGGGASPLTIEESTFAGNAALGGGLSGGEGGAIRFEFGTALTARASTFSGNTITGGQGEGGAIRFESGEGSQLLLENSTLTANSIIGEEGEGGAIRYFGETLPERDTLLLNDTIVANTLGKAGEGAGISGAKGLHAVNTIIAGNTIGGAPGDCDTPVASSDHSLSFPSNTCGLDLSGNPLLGPLANNGGPTLTMMPGLGSAAIDAGDSARCPAIDQRLVARPNDFGTPCDIGAVESGIATGPPQPPQQPAAPLGGGNKESVPPVLANLAQSHATWRLGHKLAVLSRRRPPVGTTFSFTLNEQASVSLSFTRTATGRRVNKHRCVSQNAHNRQKPSCRLQLPAGTLTLTGHAGIDRIAFQGRITSKKQLAPGRYTVLVRATNAAGQVSASRSLSFTVVR
jgi:hypothetical protein